MCTLMQKDVLIENLAETSAFIGMRFKGVEHIPLEFSMCGLLMYFILPHDALSAETSPVDANHFENRLYGLPQALAEP